MPRCHITQLDDPSLLPFAKSRLKAMRKLGLKYVSQQFDVGDSTVKVRVAGDDEYVSISGGGALWVLVTLLLDVTEDPSALSHTQTTTRKTKLFRVSPGSNGLTGKLMYSGASVRVIHGEGTNPPVALTRTSTGSGGITDTAVLSTTPALDGFYAYGSGVIGWVNAETYTYTNTSIETYNPALTFRLTRDNSISDSRQRYTRVLRGLSPISGGFGFKSEDTRAADATGSGTSVGDTPAVSTATWTGEDVVDIRGVGGYMYFGVRSPAYSGSAVRLRTLLNTAPTAATTAWGPLSSLPPKTTGSPYTLMEASDLIQTNRSMTSLGGSIANRMGVVATTAPTSTPADATPLSATSYLRPSGTTTFREYTPIAGVMTAGKTLNFGEFVGIRDDPEFVAGLFNSPPLPENTLTLSTTRSVSVSMAVTTDAAFKL